jgi:hypothetical protein
MRLLPPVETKKPAKKSRAAVPLNRKYTVKKIIPGQGEFGKWAGTGKPLTFF